MALATEIAVSYSSLPKLRVDANITAIMDIIQFSNRLMQVIA